MGEGSIATILLRIASKTFKRDVVMKLPDNDAEHTCTVRKNGRKRTSCYTGWSVKQQYPHYRNEGDYERKECHFFFPDRTQKLVTPKWLK